MYHSLDEDFVLKYDADESPMTRQSGMSNWRRIEIYENYRPRYGCGLGHGWNGRFKKRFWWSKLAEVRRVTKHYDVLATNTFGVSSQNWWKDLVSEDIENGDVVIDDYRNDDTYYERLLAVNDIGQKLKAGWATSGEWDYRSSICWHDSDDYQEPDMDDGPWSREDVEAEADRIETAYFAQMLSTETEIDTRNWDFMENERRLDEEVTATTLSQHGGARGWKATVVSNQRLIEATF